MGLFSKILDKLGLGKKDEPAAAGTAAAKPAAPAAPPPAPKPAATTAAPAKPAAPASKPAVTPPLPQAPKIGPTAEEFAALRKEPVKAAEPAVQAISEVDVVKKLEQMTEGSGLDWKVSIVDLLKVLGIDSSLAARKELAEELGCPADLMGGDHSKMNIWLHKTVLKKIAENGGNIPQSLLD